MEYALIVAWGLLFAIRGQKSIFITERKPDFFGIWRENVDFLLTVGLAITLYALAMSLERFQAVVHENALVFFGLVSLALSRHQKKNDVFFLAATILAFFITASSPDILRCFSLAWAMTVGMGLFQTSFIGLRHRLLLSRTAGSVRGWPALCFLAAFISLALWGIGQWVF